MPKFDYANVTNSGEFAAAARNIRARGTSLKSDVQKVLICGLVHMESCGDYTSSVIPVLDAIKDAFGKNLHVAAQEWVLQFSWLAWDETEKKFRKDQSKVMRIADAKAVNWWATERKPKAVPFDAQKAIATLFDKFAAEVEAGRGNMSMYLDAVIARAKEANPTLVLDLVTDLPVDAQNEILTVIVARMTPANDETEVEAEAPAEAVAA